MPFYHASKCGGDISVVLMRCKRCHKQWNPISFLFDPVNIRRYSVPKERKTSYANWAKNTPVGEVASRLPNWPRWARVLAVSPIVIGIVVGLLWGFGVIRF